MKKEINIPEKVSIKVERKYVEVTGSLGTLKRDFAFMPLVQFTSDGKVFTITTPRERKEDKMFLNTALSHINNLIEGVMKGYRYKLEIVHVHFPMRLNVKGDDLTLENFLGSKVQRKTWKYPDVTVKVKGKEVIVEGLNKEEVGQTSANLEQLTKIKGKDRRVFRDGIYRVERGNMNE